MKKLFRIAVLAMSVFVLFAACGSDTKEEGQASVKGLPPAVDNETVVIATADETPSLTTAGHNAVAGDYINKIVYNGLFKMNKELNPVPDLVENYTVEKDENGEETIWKMTLHNGIKFHDGSVMTSDDVIASLNEAKKSAHVATYTKSIIKMEKIDDLNFVLYTDGPSSSLLYDLAHHGNFIIPKALIESGNNFNENPIGAGPYKFVNWTQGTELTFTAHTDYFDKDNAPKIKNIVWKIIPEGSSRTIALEAGEIDFIIELDSTSITSIESNKDLALINVPSVSHSWLTVNNEVKPFDDLNVRKALSCAINRDDVVTVALNGAGVPATAQVPMGMLGGKTDGFDSYDIEKAKEYMKAWGGDPSTIKLDIICSNDTKRRAAEVIQANLAEIGINAKIESMDLATYLSVTAAGDFTGFIGGFTSNNMMAFLKGVYHSQNINSSNKTRTNVPKLDELIDLSTKTVDKDAREKILFEIAVMLNENCYQMPLWQDSRLSAHNALLKNTFITTSGDFFPQEWSW
ncbi:MAG: peptide ABC transporter substrate-binding protein [Treponema sp.]|nr:MAG: peptide ABC transporter substrate-binding protein [Treponema sp.]